MLPRALLFSSDEPTATVVREVLASLQIELVHSLEIFAAVEELTTRNFQVILIDWIQELEASFLFNIARDLKSTKNTYSIVIADARLAPALTIDPDDFLEKPFTAEQVREALLRSHTVHPPAGVSVTSDASVPSTVMSRMTAEERLPARVPRIDQGGSKHEHTGPYCASEPASTQQTMTRASTQMGARRPLLRRERSTGKKAAAVFCLLTLLGTVVHAEKELGYLPGNTYRSLTEFLLSPGNESRMPIAGDTLSPKASTELSLDSAGDHTGDNYFSGILEHAAVRPIFREGYPNHSHPTHLVEKKSDLGLIALSTGAIAPGAAPLIPSSLYLSPQRIPMFQGLPHTALTPASWTGQPILVPEETSRSMLIHQVSPNYPLEVLRAGLQGPVVFQALVGRDGTIQDLKLEQGYLALGIAAVDAVKQWRFRPYRVNGEVVEMRTFLTIAFPTANEVGKSNSNGSVMTYGAWR